MQPGSFPFNETGSYAPSSQHQQAEVLNQVLLQQVDQSKLLNESLNGFQEQLARVRL